MIKNIKFLHFEALESTNQKLYQLCDYRVRSWMCVSTDIQTSGKGYSDNAWVSEPYKNATFSFSIHQSLLINEEMPYFNMWVASQIVEFLTICQVEARVKWPNDIILNSKKIGGILIESKLIGTKTKFSVIGIGINIMQKNFENLNHASSIVNEYPGFKIEIHQFIQDLMHHFYQQYNLIEDKRFDKILNLYNRYLFRKDQVSVFEFNEKKINGIIKYVKPDGNIVIELEGIGEKTFMHKQIQLLY